MEVEMMDEPSMSATSCRAGGTQQQHIVRLNESDEEGSANGIKTSKYTALSFLPFNLFEQFRRVANMYFLLVAIVQSIPGVAPFPLWTSVAPLVFILSVTAVKDGYEDWLRHREDDRYNRALYQVLHQEGDDDVNLKTLRSDELKCGMVLRLEEDMALPADCILLVSSHSDGTAYVNTSALDGEAAPKMRRCVPQTHFCGQDKSLLHGLSGTFVSPPPTRDLDGFVARLEIEPQSLQELARIVRERATGSPAGDAAEEEEDTMNESEEDSALSQPVAPLGDRELLMRGVKLVNTEWVYALVVYTGVDTKLMLNRHHTPFKFARFERLLNRCVGAMLVMNIVLCLLLALGPQLVDHSQMGLEKIESSGFKDFMLDFATMWVLNSFMVPISLYVTIELVKLVQAQMIEWDTSEQCVNSRVRNSSLNEELGSIKYVFTDKTGTLTQNHMVLNRAWIGTETDTPDDHIDAGALYFNEATAANVRSYETALSHLVEQAFDSEGKPKRGTCAFEFVACTLASNAALPLRTLVDKEDEDVRHLGVDEEIELSDGERVEWRFQSSSPDEVAFLEALRDNGITLTQRTGNTAAAVLSKGDYYNNEELNFALLAQLDFSSARRRMSVVVRDAAGRIVLYTKGADSLLIEDGEMCRPRGLASCSSALEAFASTGARTLCFAWRELDAAEFEEWYPKYQRASTALHDREKRVEKCFARIERDLTLAAATAVEDHLQHGVPETVAALLEAGIEIMMLTGDKRETAVTIARHASLIGPEDRVEHLELATCAQQLGTLVDEFRSQEGSAGGRKRSFVAVITGDVLERCLNTCPQMLAQAFRAASAFVCCRATPNQKAAMVDLIRHDESTEEHHLTLAIGDGANDVSMIQASHVGIGILGKEGAQAALSADVVVQRFAALERLLFVHGRWSLLRTSKVVLFCFYKNMLFPFPQVWYVFLSKYSGVSIYDSLLLTLFNVIFTSLPPFVVGFIEKDVDDRVLQRVPRAYAAFRDGRPVLDLKQFFVWIACAVCMSVPLFVLPVVSWQQTGGVLSDSGQAAGLYALGTMIGSVAIIVVNLRLLMLTHEWNAVSLLSAFAGIVAYFAVFLVYETMCTFTPEMCGVVSHVFGSSSFWAIALPSLALCLLPAVLWDALEQRLRPRLADTLRHQQKAVLKRTLSQQPPIVAVKVDARALRSSARQPDDADSDVAPR